MKLRYRLVRVGPPEKKKMNGCLKAILIGLGVTCTGCIVVICVMSYFLYRMLGGTPPPTDDQLLSNFATHKQDFSRIAQMLDMDKKHGVNYGWCTYPEVRKDGPEDKKAPRLQEYFRLLKDAQVPLGFTDFADRTRPVECFVWLDGLIITDGQGKGYAYSVTEPKLLLPSLDQCPPSSVSEKDTYRAYRHIKGNWYLFYEHTPG